MSDEFEDAETRDQWLQKGLHQFIMEGHGPTLDWYQNNIYQRAVTAGIIDAAGVDEKALENIFWIIRESFRAGVMVQMAKPLNPDDYNSNPQPWIEKAKSES